MKHVHEIAEQDAVYDGTPDFPPIGMLMEILNYYALGGTNEQAKHLRVTGEAPNAKRYKTRIIVEYEEYDMPLKDAQ